MSANAMMKKQGLFFSPKKSFELLVYNEQMVAAFADFSCSKPKRCKDTYTLNVLHFIDGSTLKGRESLDLSKSSDSATKSSNVDS